MSNQLKTRILSNLKNTKPYSKLFFQFSSISLIFLVSVLMAVCSFVLTYIIWDSVRIINLTRFSRHRLLSFIELGMYEGLIIIIILAIITYTITRRLDIRILRSRVYLSLAIVSIIISLGCSAYIILNRRTPMEYYFLKVNNRLDKLPHRRAR
jgi:hypothetical protein